MQNYIENITYRDVCLVSPPFSMLGTPSLALGLLKSILLNAGISCRVDYADVYFGYALGLDVVKVLNNGTMNDFLGEYVFAEFAGITPAATKEDFRAELGKRYPIYGIHDIECTVRHAKEVCKAELDRTADRILACNPKVVGVSSMFQQRNAALAILKRIKEKNPDVVTFMGGANCFGAAGLRLLKTFDYLDYVFFGESDGIFAETIRIMMKKDNAPLPYGVLRRTDPLPEIPPHRIEHDMDSIPYPDYDEFYSMMGRTEGKYIRNVLRKLYGQKDYLDLVLEGSRGCWWGEKCPCTFCGLHGEIREFRKKSPDRFFGEVQFMAKKYGINRVILTDCIIPKEWFQGLLQRFRDTDVRYEFFVETRTTYTGEQIKLLADAGFMRLQPGIESLSDHSLKLMHKGTTTLTNIHFLKCAEQHGMGSAWNILYGFPGETAEDYAEQIEVAELITHLAPPNNCADMLIARENEYHLHPEQYGMHLVPADFYRFSCPADAAYISDIAIMFDRIGETTPAEITGFQQRLGDAVNRWHRAYYSGTVKTRLDMAEMGDKILIIDTRSCRDLRAQLLVGVEKDIYQACIKPMSIEELKILFDGKYDFLTIIMTLQRLKSKKLLLLRGERALALAVVRTMQEMKNLDIRQFKMLYNEDYEFRNELNSSINRRAEEESVDIDTAFARTLTEYARRLHMCFTAEDYLNASYTEVTGEL